MAENKKERNTSREMIRIVVRFVKYMFQYKLFPMFYYSCQEDIQHLQQFQRDAGAMAEHSPWFLTTEVNVSFAINVHGTESGPYLFLSRLN